MQLALDINSQEYLFGTNDLERLGYLTLQGRPIPSRGYRDALFEWFFKAIIKLRGTGIAAPQVVILKAWIKATGISISKRTLQRALDKAEASGKIRKQTLRVGDDRFKTIIYFCPVLFLSDHSRAKKPKSAPTPTHTNPQVTTCHKVNRTKTESNNPRSETSYCTVVSQPTARVIDLDKARTKKKKLENKKEEKPKIKPGKPKSKQYRNTKRLMNQLAWYIWQHTPPKDRNFAARRADLEMEWPDIPSHSGVDWEYWASRWGEMLKSEREATFRNNILPPLLKRGELPIEKPDEPSQNAYEDTDKDFMSRLKAKYEAGELSAEETEALIRARQNLIGRRE